MEVDLAKDCMKGLKGMGGHVEFKVLLIEGQVHTEARAANDEPVSYHNFLRGTLAMIVSARAFNLVEGCECGACKFTDEMLQEAAEAVGTIVAGMTEEAAHDPRRN